MKIATDVMIDINDKTQKAYDALMAVDTAIFMALGNDLESDLIRRLDKVNDDLCEVFDDFGATYIKR